MQRVIRVSWRLIVGIRKRGREEQSKKQKGLKMLRSRYEMREEELIKDGLGDTFIDRLVNEVVKSINEYFDGVDEEFIKRDMDMLFDNESYPFSNYFYMKDK